MTALLMWHMKGEVKYESFATDKEALDEAHRMVTKREASPVYLYPRSGVWSAHEKAHHMSGGWHSRFVLPHNVPKPYLLLALLEGV